jgi:hypothetical protein
MGRCPSALPLYQTLTGVLLIRTLLDLSFGGACPKPARLRWKVRNPGDTPGTPAKGALPL